MKEKSRRESSSNKNDYMTPDWLVLRIEEGMGPIALDPCASDDPKYHFAERNYSLLTGQDGLAMPWGPGLTFCNPPYGKDPVGKPCLPQWCTKAVNEALGGQHSGHAPVEVIMLLPGYLERRWWQKLLYSRMDTTCYYGKRINFMDPARGAKPWRGSGWFPSVVVYLGDRAKVFERTFAGEGFFIRPIGR